MSSRAVTACGITADVTLGWRDFGAVSIGGDVIRGGDRTAAALHGGARLGSYPAAVGTGLAAVWAALVIVALSGAGT